MAKILDGRIGDVVRLKSGGPDMVIVAVDVSSSMPMYTCMWFDKNYDCRKLSFMGAVLYHVDHSYFENKPARPPVADDTGGEPVEGSSDLEQALSAHLLKPNKATNVASKPSKRKSN